MRAKRKKSPKFNGQFLSQMGGAPSLERTTLNLAVITLDELFGMCRTLLIAV